MSGQCQLKIYLLLNHNDYTKTESEKFYLLNPKTNPSPNQKHNPN